MSYYMTSGADAEPRAVALALPLGGAGAVGRPRARPQCVKVNSSYAY